MSCSAPLLAPLLALLSAFLFAVAIQLARLGLRHVDSQTAALIQIGAATAVYWIGAPFVVETRYWLSAATLLFAAIGVFRPFLSANLALAGTQRLGPSISSTLSATSPLFGVSLGALVLGERLTAPVLLGTAAIVAGGVLLSWEGRARRDWQPWALLLPVGAALIRAVAQMLAKVGMATLPSPFFVGLVGYTVSFGIAALLGGRRAVGPAGIVTPGAGWLVAMGVVNGMSILSLNTALQCGRLSVVSPITACSPLFALLLGWLVFRERAITRRVVVAVLVVVPGVVAITLRG